MTLAAINSHETVVNFFLSHEKADILRNGNGQNILDIAVSLGFKEVAGVIAKHDRSVTWSSLLSMIRFVQQKIKEQRGSIRALG